MQWAAKFVGCTSLDNGCYAKFVGCTSLCLHLSVSVSLFVSLSPFMIYHLFSNKGIGLCQLSRGSEFRRSVILRGERHVGVLLLVFSSKGVRVVSYRDDSVLSVQMKPKQKPKGGPQRRPEGPPISPPFTLHAERADPKLCFNIKDEVQP